MSRRSATCLVAVLFLVVSGTVAASADSGTTYTWVGSSMNGAADNHSWSDANNWNPAGVPSDGDSVIIEQPSSTDCFAHVDGVPTVTLADFTLVESPTLCTTSISGGAITVTNGFTWDGGTLDTPTTIDSGAIGTVSGANQRASTLSEELDVDGTLTLSGVGDQGELDLIALQVLHIEPGGSLVSSGTNEIGGSACCTHPAKVINDGTVVVDAGTFTIGTAEFDQNATIATLSAGRLLTTAAPVTAGAGGNYTGNGGWTIENGASARFSGTQTLGHHFHLELGGLNTTSSSTLSGTTTLAGTGTFDWTGGVIAAQLTIDHGIAVQAIGAHNGNARRLLQGRDFSGGGAGVPVTQTNHGTFTVANGATISTSATTHLVNAADGTIGLAAGSSFSSGGCCTSPDRISNSGTLAVTSVAGSGPAVLAGVAYEAHGGSTVIASGRTLQLTGGAPNKLTATTVTGGGHLAVDSPTAASGTITIGLHTRLGLGSHGSLDGTATLAGTGALTWTGGSISGNVTVSTSGGVAISGTDTKTVANIGGGSTPSKLTLRAPTTIAAGTSKAHDFVVVGSSVLTLASSTSAGAFTDFDNGTVANRGTLSLARGKVFAGTYDQTTHGDLAIDLAATKRGLLRVLGTATLRGSVAAHNSYRPTLGAKVTIAKAASMQDSVSCVATSGTGSTGSHAGHWSPKDTATRLELVWRRGAHTDC